MNQNITTRFAPSPTGYLHIGGLRTALYSYLWAKKNAGKFILRIEDTDLKRNSKEAAQAILDAFSWVGLDTSDKPYFQSQRFDIYAKYIKQLLDENKAYYCYMSKEELDTLREEQRKNGQRTKYDNRYRDFTGTPPKDIKPVIRIKTPTGQDIKFHDGIKGDMCVNTDDVMDDFIIARSDGTPTFNFVVAIDDALMGITDIMRGEDHLSNTPKQIVVYKALGFDIPNFYHIPMINNEQGKKLSKRDGAMDVMEYKKNGYLPEALLNFLVRLGWSHGDQEIFNMEEMIKLFDPNTITKSSSSYNLSKLEWLNAQYIMNTTNERLIEELKYFDIDISNLNTKDIIIEALKPRSKTILEMATQIKTLLTSPKEYNEKAVKKHLKPARIQNLKDFYTFIKEYENIPTNEKEYENLFNQFLEKYECKMGHVAQPLRIALTGSAVSPAINDTLFIIGYEEVIHRIEKLLNNNF